MNIGIESSLFRILQEEAEAKRKEAEARAAHWFDLDAAMRLEENKMLSRVEVLIKEFRKQPVYPFADLEKYKAQLYRQSLLYAFYYLGDKLKIYAKLAELNRKSFVCELNVGKAEDDAYNDRFKRYLLGFTTMLDLDINEFYFRWLYGDPKKVASWEDEFIKEEKPVWNKCTSGWGTTHIRSGMRRETQIDAMFGARPWIAEAKLLPCRYTKEKLFKKTDKYILNRYGPLVMPVSPIQVVIPSNCSDPSHLRLAI